MNTYEGLMEYVPGGTAVRPALATSYTAANNNTKFTFKLRSGVTFHDGSTLDSSAVVASFRRLQEINQGPASLLPPIASISAPDAQTVVITLAKPNAFFVSALPWFVIVSKTALDAHKTSADPQAKNWFATNEAGTGPYTIGQFQSGVQILLAQNPHYWRKWGANTPTKVLLNQASDESTLLELIQTGKSDFTGHLMSPTAIADARKLSNVVEISAPAYSVRQMNMPMVKPPLDRLELRQALQYAFPYEAYVRYYNGSAVQPNSPLAVQFPGWDSSIPYPRQDLTKAASLLSKAGFPGGKGLTLSFMGVAGESYESFAGTLLQSSLAKLGVKLNVLAAPWPQIYPVMGQPSNAYDFGFLDTAANTPNAGGAIAEFWSSSNIASKGGYNWSYFQNKSVDKALEDAQATTDVAQQNEHLSYAQKTIMASAPAIFGASANLTQMVSKPWAKVKYDALFDWDTIRFFFFQKGA
jgi:peptide/nickel transport system substrate-binding protein